MQNIKPLISIVMPALNEENNISFAVQNTLKAFEDFNIDGEVIVVNDGSTDRTAEIVAQLIKTDSRVRIIHHKTPQGIGFSFWDGVDNTACEFVSMFPGDNENDPWEILQYLKLLDHVDMVIPFAFNRQARSIWRNILSFTYRFIINTTFLVNFNYTNGTVLYRTSVLKELDYRSSSFFFQTDILIRAVKRGYLFAEVPYRLGFRKTGTSKAVSFPSFLRVAKGYLRLFRDLYKTKKVDDSESFAAGSSTARRHQSQNTQYKT